VTHSTRQREPSDAELVRQAQRGASTAFAELVARYQDRVFNTCYRMCHNHADALDLAQATFLKALEHLPRFRARASFYTWLFRIAVNEVMSHRRAQGRRTPASLDELRDRGRTPAEQRAADGAATAEQRELQDRVAWALEQLDDEFRVAVVLKDIEDMDYAAIADVLEIPVGTVKSRIHRGRLLLRELLRAERIHVGGP
jgi:RNA polymerase sigma-70 factor (ECF subfamily)